MNDPAPAAAVAAGTVYLLHFARPYRHARHYLGYADNLEQRAAAGIDWRLVRTWPGTRTMERRLKGRHSGVRLCPLFRGLGQRGAGPAAIVTAPSPGP